MGYTWGTKWDDSRIKSEVKNVMTALGIDRMPTRAEIDKFDSFYASLQEVEDES